ncbi:hypothetical protein DKT74_36545 [Streptomyces sp. ZEA17I]|nr:hypothetical protein DKT74_36545 [Streptomyces sp. ZEA17I]
MILPYGWETPTGSSMPTSSPLVPYGGEVPRGRRRSQAGGEELPCTPVRRHGGNQDERVESVPRRGRVEVRHQDVPWFGRVRGLRGPGKTGLRGHLEHLLTDPPSVEQQIGSRVQPAPADFEHGISAHASSLSSLSDGEELGEPDFSRTLFGQRTPWASSWAGSAGMPDRDQSWCGRI